MTQEKGFDLAIGHSLILVVLGAYIALLYWTRRLPTIDTYREAAKVAETHGGQIVILATLTVFFFLVSMGFAYYTMDALIDGTIKPDNALVMVILTWMTGGAFGATMGALIKTMSAPVAPGDTPGK
jgi:hypothetical protein